MLLVEVGGDVARRVYCGPYVGQVAGGGLLHLYLDIAVGGVYIVKLLDPAGPRVGFLFGVQVFVEVHNPAFPA